MKKSVGVIVSPYKVKLKDRRIQEQAIRRTFFKLTTVSLIAAVRTVAHKVTSHSRTLTCLSQRTSHCVMKQHIKVTTNCFLKYFYYNVSKEVFRIQLKNITIQ